MATTSSARRRVRGSRDSSNSAAPVCTLTLTHTHASQPPALHCFICVAMPGGATSHAHHSLTPPCSSLALRNLQRTASGSPSSRPLRGWASRATPHVGVWVDAHTTHARGAARVTIPREVDRVLTIAAQSSLRRSFARHVCPPDFGKLPRMSHSHTPRIHTHRHTEHLARHPTVTYHTPHALSHTVKHHARAQRHARRVPHACAFDGGRRYCHLCPIHPTAKPLNATAFGAHYSQGDSM